MARQFLPLTEQLATYCTEVSFFELIEEVKGDFEFTLLVDYAEDDSPAVPRRRIRLFSKYGSELPLNAGCFRGVYWSLNGEEPQLLINASFQPSVSDVIQFWMEIE